MQSIVLIGNCQLGALRDLYLRFSEASARQRLTFIASYENLSEEDRIAIAQADLIIQQVQDFQPKADIAGIESLAERVLVPVVSCNFLWPFAGPTHPNAPILPYSPFSPYPAEVSDGWLNRMIKTGVDPETAVDCYVELDINSMVNLDRLSRFRSKSSVSVIT